MFFRKKRGEEGDSYDRISRMIEGRQADGEGDPQAGDDLFEEETVLLARPSDRREPPREGGSRGDSFSVAPGRDREPGFESLASDVEPVQEGVTVVRAPERQPASASVATSRPSDSLGTSFSSLNLDQPRMPSPDLAAAAGSAGTPSLIAKDATWEGKLNCSGNVRVEGTLRGEIQTTGTLFVAAEAHVDGSVRARNVTLAGEIQGDMTVDERLEILPGGAARGEVNTGALVVHEGAHIDSRFQMQRDAAASGRPS